MPKIFVSYRRVDSQERAHRIADWLVLKYGRDNIFIDIDTIGGGHDFAKAIVDSLDKSDVVLVIIGNRWVDELVKRTESESLDFVRLEVRKSLKDIPLVIPVLLDRQVQIDPNRLPKDVRGIVRLNYMYARLTDFHQDMERIRMEIDKLSGEEPTLVSRGKSEKGSNQSSRLPLIALIAILLLVVGGLAVVSSGILDLPDIQATEAAQLAKTAEFDSSSTAVAENLLATGTAAEQAIIDAWTNTPTPTSSPSSTPSVTPTQTPDLTQTAKSVLTAISRPTSTSTLTYTPTMTLTLTPTATATNTPTSTNTPHPTDTVTSIPPELNATAATLLSAEFETKIVDLQVAFTSKMDAVNLTHHWDFGDENTSTEANPTHEYVSAGTYNVVHTVRSPRRNVDHKQEITVSVLASQTPTESVSQLPIGEIAFVSDRDGDDEIYIMSINDNMDTDGNTPIQLTDNEGIDDHSPSWSPDGTKIVFVSDRDGRDNLYILNVETREVMPVPVSENVINFPYSDPAWSPDDTRIAFTRADSQKRLNVHSIPIEGGTEKDLTIGSSHGNPTWSPDSNKIADIGLDDGEIYVIRSSDGTRLRQLTVNNHNNIDPAWSPDENLLAFASDREGNFDIFTINPNDGSELTQITVDETNEIQPAWSPDGSLIAFVSDRDGNNEIYIMSSDGNNVTRITADGSNDQQPTWRRIN